MTAGRVDALAAEADRMLAGADKALAASYPGPRPGRQPVHTVYVPADRFGPWGDALLEAVRKGKVDEALIDDKVLNVLRLAARVGALATLMDRLRRPAH